MVDSGGCSAVSNETETAMANTGIRIKHHTVSYRQCWALQVYTQIRNCNFRKTARGGLQPQFRKFAIHLR